VSGTVLRYCAAQANQKLKIENNKSENCPGQESNLHEPKPTSPSSWRVCQFRHPGELIYVRPQKAGETSP
jgi:hypothetical protein